MEMSDFKDGHWILRKARRRNEKHGNRGDAMARRRNGMALYEFDAVRLCVAADLAENASVALDKAQANYLLNVMRLGPGDRVLVFNGRDGEHVAAIGGDRKRPLLVVGARVRAQTPTSPIRFLFAPLKHARLDYMVEKAVELGVGSIEPVITRRTQVARVNLDRMQANIIEAAEQCGVISLPILREPEPLETRLAALSTQTRLVFCDEDAPIADPLSALEGLDGPSIAVLIGPEGGFDPRERQMLLAVPGCLRLSLGPRILRADTAAVAALALIQAACGDWRTLKP
jgi:16S rRNA (uracil1498-N3)-methyltransferase